MYYHRISCQFHGSINLGTSSNEFHFRFCVSMPFHFAITGFVINVTRLFRNVQNTGQRTVWPTKGLKSPSLRWYRPMTTDWGSSLLRWAQYLLAKSKTGQLVLAEKRYMQTIQNSLTLSLWLPWCHGNRSPSNTATAVNEETVIDPNNHTHH